MLTRMTAEDAEREFSRQRRLVDQMITMQSRLRDWNGLAGALLTSIILLASTVGVGFAFASDSSVITIAGISAQRTTWLGWLAVMTAALTVIDLVIDRRSAARSRADAVRILSELKAEYRVGLPPGAEVAEVERISAKYAATFNAVPPIPDYMFNRLKAAHLRKVEISKIISARPGISPLGAWLEMKRNLKRGADTP